MKSTSPSRGFEKKIREIPPENPGKYEKAPNKCGKMGKIGKNTELRTRREMHDFA